MQTMYCNHALKGKPWSLSSLQTTVASSRVQLLSHTGDHTPSLLHISTSWRLLLFTSLTTVTLPSEHDESVIMRQNIFIFIVCVFNYLFFYVCFSLCQFPLCIFHYVCICFLTLYCTHLSKNSLN